MRSREQFYEKPPPNLPHSCMLDADAQFYVAIALVGSYTMLLNHGLGSFKEKLNRFAENSDDKKYDIIKALIMKLIIFLPLQVN